MMMNNFGVPATEADINMSSNPAKAMLEQQLATTGVNNNIIGAIIGGAVSLFGAKKQADAQKSNVEAQNQQTQLQYEYDLKKYKSNKKQIQNKHKFTIDQITTQAENEEKLAEYKDKTNKKNYNYQLKIVNKKQELQDKMYEKSEKVYEDQLKINALEEMEELRSQYQQLYEIQTENRYQQQDLINDTLIAEGQIRALGQTGNTAAKRVSANAISAGTKMTLLSLSLENATKASALSVRNIRSKKAISDLNAEAKKMLDPGNIPKPPKPIATPTAKYVFPPALKQFDFGPKPIKGAMYSPSAAAGAVWGSAISGIAGSVMNYSFNKMLQ